MEKTTPLYETHRQSGGRMVPFAGYLMPVQYEAGVIAEHMAVRKACGLFDVSHMGEITCTGPDALSLLNRLLTNDFTNMTDGQARYSVMCQEDGGCVDDLIVYKVKEDHYFIVVNAANKEKDFAWMKGHEEGNAVFTDISDSVAQIAVQGPKAKEILGRLLPQEAFPVRYYSANFDTSVHGMRCVISKSGYTGSDGYELYLTAEDATAMWQLLLETGKEDGLLPCGLGARDTLRLEAGMPLYGHEMNESISPLEAGLSFAVKLQKEDFIGKDALTAKPLTRIRVGLKVTGRGIVREHMTVYQGDTPIGETTSGTHAPYLGYPIAMALVTPDVSAVGTKLTADVRGRRVEMEVVPLPFYSETRKKSRK
ncbi:MAG: glycine cleavage system aminomethyltransferase GcvT [Lachnospiraceae bacterium]|nr:glycine cleavage system aminomethyltransferase GcvT [Lachnospiraceae bacterium]